MTAAGNGQRRQEDGRVPAMEREPRLWWFIVSRGVDLELRTRRTKGHWRMRCPVDGSHEVTIANGVGRYQGWGIALTCHGPAGADSPGHSLTLHRRQIDDPASIAEMDERYYHLPDEWPCRWCGCAESQVLDALGARPKDKFLQAEAQRDGRCSRCSASGYRIGRGPILCLGHLADRVGLDRHVLFGQGPK